MVKMKQITIDSLQAVYKFESLIMPEVNTGCFLWNGTLLPDGYGKFVFNGSQYAAHRFSYTLYKGTIPDNFCVCHKCDNPSCVNPDHLFVGTYRDNVLDCKSKGRLNRVGAKGERQHKAKLTEDAVKKIRTRFMSERKMAKHFGVVRSVIQDVLSGKSWKHVKT